MLNFNFSEKGLGLVSPPYFVYEFSKKNVSYATFYSLTKFHFLIAFTSRDIFLKCCHENVSFRNLMLGE